MGLIDSAFRLLEQNDIWSFRSGVRTARHEEIYIYIYEMRNEYVRTWFTYLLASYLGYMNKHDIRMTTPITIYDHD